MAKPRGLDGPFQRTWEVWDEEETQHAVGRWCARAGALGVSACGDDETSTSVTDAVKDASSTASDLSSTASDLSTTATDLTDAVQDATGGG